MFERPILEVLKSRIAEPRRFMQIILGPRQVGKTTLVRQLEDTRLVPTIYASADEAQARDNHWLETQWQRARQLVESQPGSTPKSKGVLLVIDEIQKIERWSETVKAAWDADTRRRINLKVILLGSTPLFAGRGTQESLAGRYEILYAPHWSLAEMAKAFNYSWEEYLYFGGYPGAASLRHDEVRWRSYMREAIVEATIGRDLLSSVRIDKPALLRQLFFLACEYSGRILSYTKMLGQLQDAGNTTTLAHYLELLTQSRLITGIQKISLEKARTRASSPKLLSFDASLITAQDDRSYDDWRQDPEALGHLIENCVGAYLWRAAQQHGDHLYYWSEGNLELDFVYMKGKQLLAIEVKSGRRRRTVSGLTEFKQRHPKATTLVVGTGGVPIQEFLATDPRKWLATATGR